MRILRIEGFEANVAQCDVPPAPIRFFNGGIQLQNAFVQLEGGQQEISEIFL